MRLMTHEEANRFIETVRQIRESNGPLSQYFEREIADAIQSLINAAVVRERENCAILAESFAEPAGTLVRGQLINVDPQRGSICLEVAEAIRNRR
jgi:hypothetical protein